MPGVSGSGTVVAAFEVPDVSVPFTGSPARDDAEALRAGAIGWGVEHRLISQRGAARLSNSPLLDLGTALCGSASPRRAGVLMDWFVWVLVLDDRIDDGPWAERGVLDRFTSSVDRIVQGRPDADACDPMLTVLATDLWPRTCQLAEERWVARMRDHLIRHLRAQCVLVRTRVSGQRVPMSTYRRLRRDAFGAYVFFDLIEAAEGLTLAAQRSCDGNCLAWLRQHAADIISWTNDIFSVEKDVIHGERFNLVRILTGERGLSWQSAVDSAHHMVLAAVRSFDKVKRLHLAHQAADSGQAVRQAVSYVGRLEQIVRDAVDWHRTVSRYHIGAGSAGPGSNSVDTRFTPPTLKSREFESDPYPLYQRLRTTLPVVYDEPTDAWLLSRHADVRSALTDPRFSTRNYAWQIAPLLGHCIVSMDGKEHAAHRALLTPAFRSRALEVMHSAITEVLDELIARLRGRDMVDLVPWFCTMLPIKVMARALGLPARDPGEVARMKNWCEVGFAYMGNYRQDPGLLARGIANRDDFYAYLQPHLDARRKDPRADLISAMHTATVDGQPLSEDYIRGCCAILLTAGSETTVAALANLLANLLDLPEAMAAVRGEPALIDLALAETLRRNPPLQLVLRQTRESVDLPSGTVPGDATVACLLGSANRDPERFARPDDFDMYRTDGYTDREYGGAASHLAFGAGRHFCLGSHLARAEITTGVTMLLAEFPNLRWAPGHGSTETGFLTRSPAQLHVTL
jgi:cytochrome P450